jgi:hypothetical protein
LLYFLNDVGFDLAEEGGRLFGYFDQDVAPVTVSVDKVVLHEHFKEGSGPEAGNDGVEGVFVGLEVCHRDAFHESLDEDRVAGALLECLREADVFVAVEVAVEDVEIVLFDVEIDLVNKGLLQRALPDRNFEALGEEGEESTDSEENVDISLDVLVHFRVSHLHRHLLAAVYSFVDLAD